MQLVTPRVVAIAVAIDTMSWIISFQVFFFVSVLIMLFFLLNINFLEVRGEISHKRTCPDCRTLRTWPACRTLRTWPACRTLRTWSACRGGPVCPPNVGTTYFRWFCICFFLAISVLCFHLLCGFGTTYGRWADTWVRPYRRRCAADSVISHLWPLNSLIL